ncbi:MAG TPA: tyrosine-type recombinase/integrase, partial [Acidimicrobiales bacterium]|nr:tyrosine-type recombinase/integrase [Acidimicrobiales bacterium]
VLRRSFAARHFNPAVVRAGLPETVTFHGLRHVATTFMVTGNEHPRTVQHRLGHATADLSMELYAHVPDALDRAAADHLDGLFSDSSGTEVARRPDGTAEDKV